MTVRTAFPFARFEYFHFAFCHYQKTQSTNHIFVYFFLNLAVDHRGCSNQQLMKEDPALASTFNNKSIAEQNSVTLAWDIFMMDEYKKLRQTMFATQEDLLRFRQLVVNIVLATDIFDRELVRTTY